MTVYDGSRYSSNVMYNELEANYYVGNRLSSLFSVANAGDKVVNVTDISALYNGKQFTILDNPNNDVCTVDSISKKLTGTVFNPISGVYQSVDYYAVSLKSALKFNHSTSAVVFIASNNNRPSVIPTLSSQSRLIVSDSNDIVIQWTYNDRLDIHAYNYLGDPQLSWAILDANPQYRCEFDIEPGDFVVIPSYQKVIDKIRGVI